MKKLSFRTTLIMMIGNIVVFSALYILGVSLNQIVTYSIFTAMIAGFSLGYVIYNRGFSRRGVTMDMLPPEWSEEKKKEFINSGKERMEKSKWMLTVIIPLILILGFELLDIYVIPKITSLFK